MFCRKCGNTLRDADLFCPNCGAGVVVNSEKDSSKEKDEGKSAENELTETDIMIGYGLISDSDQEYSENKHINNNSNETDHSNNIVVRQSSKTKIPMVIAAAIIIALLFGFIRLISCGSESNRFIEMVKGGHPDAFPSITYGDAFEYFFTDPEWKYCKSDNDKDVVEFTGGCLYQDVKVKTTMQFVVDLDSELLWVEYLDINGVPQSKLIIGSLISKIFESYKTDNKGIDFENNDESSKTSASSKQSNMNNQTYLNSAQVEEFVRDSNNVGKQVSFIAHVYMIDEYSGEYYMFLGDDYTRMITGRGIIKNANVMVNDDILFTGVYKGIENGYSAFTTVSVEVY